MVFVAETEARVRAKLQNALEKLPVDLLLKLRFNICCQSHVDEHPIFLIKFENLMEE